METLASLRMFVRVVDAGSFTAAGRQLDRSPSSVSRQVADLESHLGTRLLTRTTRTLTPTEAGRLYFERAARIIHDVDEARLAVSQLESPSGILRVAVPAGVGRTLVIQALPAFLEQYPQIRVVASMTDATQDLVREGIDVAIRLGQPKDASLIVKKIGESRRVVCASPSYLERVGRPRKPADLAELDCLLWREYPGHSTWTFRAAGISATSASKPDQSMDVRVRGSFYARNADALVAAAVAGLGLILLPDWNVGTELQSRQLVSVLGRYRAVPEVTPVYAVHTQPRFVPPKTRAFIDFLSQRFARPGFPPAKPAR